MIIIIQLCFHTSVGGRDVWFTQLLNSDQGGSLNLHVFQFHKIKWEIPPLHTFTLFMVSHLFLRPSLFWSVILLVTLTHFIFYLDHSQQFHPSYWQLSPDTSPILTTITSNICQTDHRHQSHLSYQQLSPVTYWQPSPVTSVILTTITIHICQTDHHH